jgi:NADH:ubiquinone oxidoreductase subunit 5 (subunit L)/multisubunit Na+/H+ antiporter MnhA subunit
MPGITDFFTKSLEARYIPPLDHHATSIDILLAAVGTLAAVVGIAAGYRIWFPDKETQAARDTFSIPGLYPLLRHKYYIDDFYMDGIIRPIRGPVAAAIDWFNGHVIDFVVNGAGFAARGIGKAVYAFDQGGLDNVFNASAASAGASGGFLRVFQTGRVQQYAVMIFAGTVLLVAGFIIF